VTDVDVTDGLLVQFAKDRSWIRVEGEWVKGRISSAECLRRQTALLRVGARALDEYLRTIPLDPGFRRLRELLRARRVPLVILSDGFDLFIRRILRFHGMSGVPFRSNRIRHRELRLVPSFPYRSASCSRCAHCKGEEVRAAQARGARVLFAGDGLSDACAAEAADRVFAKGRLADHCRKHGIAFTPFETLHDVADALRGPTVPSEVPGEEAVQRA
jgi:2,3-diketo-5-methylthio-1-phosphopentane phosphatase